MSDKPHTVAIGAFIVGALLIAATTAIFVLGTGLGKERSTVVMVFEGSVKGLSVGAPVTLRGVQIGHVKKIELILDADTVELIMLVEAEFRDENVRRQGSTTGDFTEELISRGLRAQLNTQSLLTGLLYVQLDFHPDSQLILADIESPYIQIPTIPTDLERLTRKIESIDFTKMASDLEAVVEGISLFVSAEEFHAMPANLQATLASVTALSDELKTQLGRTAPRLDSILDDAAATVATASTELPKLSALARTNLETLDEAIAAFDAAMQGIDGLVDPESATTYQLNRALRELAMAGRALQMLAKTLEEQPESLIRGKSGDDS